eukprot:scaffold13347_cov27-Tisochrysis_lutea.AAC.1
MIFTARVTTATSRELVRLFHVWWLQPEAKGDHCCQPGACAAVPCLVATTGSVLETRKTGFVTRRGAPCAERRVAFSATLAHAPLADEVAIGIGSCREIDFPACDE